MIQVHQVSMFFPIPKRYIEYVLNPIAKVKKKTALESVSLSINEGDRVAFLGVNGAGKTTLLKLIGGLLYPSSGKIEVNGYNTVTNNLKARKTVGFVLNEERSFYWRLTGIQNLQFFGALDNLKGKELDVKIDALIKLVGLEKSGNTLVAGYSSGMKQRLAIARGLLSDPQILILDEPTRTLDPKGVNDMKSLISEKISENGKRTLLIASHKFDEVEALCTKICIMGHGKVVSFDTLANVKAQYGGVDKFYYSIMKENEVNLK